MTYNPYQRIKNYKEYTETEIISMLEAEKNPYLYDYLVDKLYFYNSNKYNTKKQEYNILPARTIYYREQKETKFNNNFL